jgi:hypothetical protein
VRLQFNGGTNLTLAQPGQYVPVEPSVTYDFHAYMRTEGITTESGIRFSITDPNHDGAVDQRTENMTGSHGWTSVNLSVTSAPSTHFLVIRVVRDRSRLFENRLSGLAWIADVSLIPEETKVDGTR